jgi:hypothetical protein
MTVALNVNVILLINAPPSGRNVTVALEVVTVPLTPLTVHLALVGLIDTAAGGVPVDGALSVQPAIVTDAVPAEAGAAANAAVATTATASAASRAGRSIASPLNSVNPAPARP